MCLYHLTFFLSFFFFNKYQTIHCCWIGVWQEAAHSHPAGSTATYTDSSYYNRSTPAVYEKSQPYYQHAQVTAYTATETPAAAAYQAVGKPTYTNNNFSARQTPAAAKTQNATQNSTGTSGYMYSSNLANNNYSAPSSFGSTPVTTAATFSGTS